ncbi:MAG: glycoside hydrolase [Acutalibacteraceae bacterium]
MKEINIQRNRLHNLSFCGWGTSLCWWAHRLGFDDELSQKAAELFYGEKGLKLNIMRYNIGGGDDPNHNHITRTDSKIPGWLKINKKGEKVYDYTADKNQLNVLLRCIKESGNDAFVEAFSNSPPFFMTVSGCSSGSSDAKSDNLKQECVTEFAEYLAHVCAYIEKEMDIKIGSLAPMNEPNTAYWKEFSNKQEGCHVSVGQRQNDLLLAVSDAMKKAGLSHVNLTASDETNSKLQLLSCKNYSDDVLKVIDRISTHTYEKADKGLRDFVKERNLPLWMTETDWSSSVGVYSKEMGPGLWFSKKIIEDITVLSPQAWVMWQAIGGYTGKEPFDGNLDGPPPDMNKGFWGLGYCDFDKKEIFLSQKYYCFGQFTRFMRPGMKMLPVNRDTLACLDDNNKKLIVTAVNPQRKDREVAFNLKGFTLKASAKVVRTSGSGENAERLKSLPDIKVNPYNFNANLKGYSVTTFILEIQ